VIVLGVGVEPGTPAEQLQEAVDALFADAPGLAADQVGTVATIDTRRDEPAVRALAAGHRLRTYPAAALDAVDVPHPSPVVRRLTGTGSVAEAAALLAAREQDPAASLLVGKRRGRGVTVAVAG